MGEGSDALAGVCAWSTGPQQLHAARWQSAADCERVDGTDTSPMLSFHDCIEAKRRSRMRKEGSSARRCAG